MKKADIKVRHALHRHCILCQPFCFEFLTDYETQAASESSLASADSTYSAATGKADQLNIEDIAKAEQEKNSAVVKATATYNEQRIAVQKHAKEQYAQLREDLKANANSIAVTFEHSKNQADAVTCPLWTEWNIEYSGVLQLKQQRYTAAKEMKDQKEAKINDMQKQQLDSVHVEHAQVLRLLRQFFVC